MEITITYRRGVCPECKSRMVTHVRSSQWRFYCSMCKAEIARNVIQEVEAEEWGKDATKLIRRGNGQANSKK